LDCLQVVLDKGQREDWFGSNFIVIFSLISVVSLVLLVIRELTCRDPIVDLPLLRNRGFFASSIVMLAVGFILFGTTQLLPQLVQEVYGYTATQAGLVITPGGIGVMLLMPIVGLLLRKVQPRWLIAFGWIVECVALFHLSGFTTDANFAKFVWARIFQAAGIAFLFVPVTTVAYVGLPPGKNNNASALINLARNLGGSFGISWAQTCLARRSQFHQLRLVEHITPYDMSYRLAISHLQKALPPHSGQAPLAAFNLALQRQVGMLSYLDIFYLLAWAALLITPIVFLLRKAEPGAVAMH
jgi:DHA2 family multidrug resistance protein